MSHETRAAYTISLGLYEFMGLDLRRDEYRTLEARSGSLSRNLLNEGSAEEEGGENDLDDPSQLTTVTQTYFTFFKSFVGIGILALPHGFALSGYVGGPSVLIIVAAISYYCMALIVECRGDCRRANKIRHGQCKCDA